MLALLIFLSCVFIACATGVLAAYADFRGLSIPNQYSAIIMGSFALCYALLWLLGRDDVLGPLASHVIAAGVIFLVTLVMFMVGGLGAGDSKLATVFALWAGLGGLMPFLFYMAVIGGLLGLTALVLKKWRPIKGAAAQGWIGRVQAGENKVPYGIAIVAGALASFVKIGYFDSGVLASFVMS